MACLVTRRALSYNERLIRTGVGDLGGDSQRCFFRVMLSGKHEHSA